MKIKKILLTLICLSSLFTQSGIAGLAHSGRTDSNGGHRDNKNVSGLGSYHYHHGQSAHLHPGGICPYDTTSTTTSNNSTPTTTLKSADTSYSLGYNQGYEDAKKEQSKSSDTTDDTIRKTDYKSGYEAGYQAGIAYVKKVKQEVSEKGTTAGYQAGYEGLTQTSDQYTGAYASEYQAGYKKGYSDGLKLRNLEIQQTKETATTDGMEAGYWELTSDFSYDGKYSSEYEAAFLSAYEKGTLKLKAEEDTIRKDYYIYGMLNLMTEPEPEHPTLKATATRSFEEGRIHMDNVLENMAPFGSPIKTFSKSIEDKKEIVIGLEESNSDTLIRANNRWHFRVNEMYLDIYNYFKIGFSAIETSKLIEQVLKPSILETYTSNTTTTKRDTDATYSIEQLTKTKSSEDKLPKKLYIITKKQNNLAHEVFITTRVPQSIKRLETL